MELGGGTSRQGVGRKDSGGWVGGGTDPLARRWLGGVAVGDVACLAPRLLYILSLDAAPSLEAVVVRTKGQVLSFRKCIFRASRLRLARDDDGPGRM